MDDKKIKQAWGNWACGGLCTIGALAMVAGLLGIGLALFSRQNDVPWITFLVTFGSGLVTYAMGAALWNLIEITITSRMILRELQRGKQTARPEPEKKAQANSFARIDEMEKTLGGK